MRELGEEEGNHLVYILKDCLAGVEREGKKRTVKSNYASFSGN